MPNLYKYTILCAILLFGGIAGAQEYKLKGMIMMGSEERHKFELVFTNKGGTISGYSRTWWDEGIPFKADITGTMDSRRQTISFRETNMVIEPPAMLPRDQVMCMFNGELSYVVSGDAILCSGKFRGTELNGDECGSGTLALQGLGTATHVAAVKTAEPEVPANALIWHSDSLIINIWDYGTVDGDEATVWLNGRAVLSRYTITSSKVRLHFALKPGLNTLEIKAANPQSILPVSARVVLDDGAGHYEFPAGKAHGSDAINIMKTK